MKLRLPGLRRILASCAIAVCATVPALTAAAADMFIVKTTAKPLDAVVAAIKAHSEQRKWLYLGESKVRKDTVRLVKLCIPEVAQLLWLVDLKLSAMLPCGNVGVYRKGEAVEVSVLHPRYMHVLHPHPATERASALAQPLLVEMLDAVTQ